MAKVACSVEFRSLIESHPGALRAFRESRKAFFDRHGGLEVARMSGGSHTKGAWKVSVGGKLYFVKQSKIRELSRNWGQTGYEQFMVLREIAHFASRHVKVVQPLFGYTGNRYSYLVLPYLQFRNAGISSMPGSVLREYYAFRAKAREMGVVDLDENVFYDPAGKTAVITDPCLRVGGKMHGKLGLGKA